MLKNIKINQADIRYNGLELYLKFVVLATKQQWRQTAKSS